MRIVKFSSVTKYRINKKSQDLTVIHNLDNFKKFEIVEIRQFSNSKII